MDRNKKVISQPLLRFVETTIDHKKTNAWFFFCLSALLFINDRATKKRKVKVCLILLIHDRDLNVKLMLEKTKAFDAGSSVM